jgi:hypothetical protein
VGPNGTLVVATETNRIYGIDALTGQQLWSKFLGTPWNASDIGCPDLSPTVGITSTPAIDPATHTAYVTFKTYVNGVATYRAHAFDVATGNAKSGFPVTIQGTAANSPLTSFVAKNHLQRPGLLLMNGVVYAAFGGLCDTSPYRGWVAGINASTGAITTLWTDEALVPDPNPPQFGRPGGGIWHASGRLVSDKPGEILLASGNGDLSPVPAPGTTPPPQLGSSAIRLRVLATGHLQAVDFFTPCNGEQLSAEDKDFGTGAPQVLPAEFGTNPPLVLVQGKFPELYLLNRDAFGGYQQGAAGSCIDGSGNAGDKVVSMFTVPGIVFGPWGTPGVWPGNGGLIYLSYALFSHDKLTAFRVTPDGAGTPRLSMAGQSDESLGFGTSAPIITSTGKTSGSALVWLVRLPDGTGVGAELRAYDPVPVGGVLTLRGRWPIGQGSKFNMPTAHNGRIYIGARDGLVHAFGALPQGAAQSSPPPPRPATANEVPDQG